MPSHERAPRILFLHPKTLTDSWPFPVDTLGEVIKAPSAVYPVLAGMISHLPLEVEIFDGYVTRETFRNYKKRLSRPDFIAISVMSPLKSLDTELTVRLAKALNPKVRIILGGNHASAFPARWIDCGADFVIAGEGEVGFRSLMETLLSGADDFSHVPNLTYSEGGEIKTTPVRAPSIALDDSPFPAWDRFNLKPYRLGTVPAGHAAALELSRGCPHRCDFCNINMYWNYRQRYKSVERVIEEMERLHRLGVREFIFTDDNFAHDYRRTAQLLEEMIRRDFGFGFGSFLRGDTVRLNPEFPRLAARAGMRFCLMGIETLDPTWLKEHRKGVRAPDVVQMWADVYRTLRQSNIFLVGLFITPPEVARPVISGKGTDGVVCDFHYTADLVAQKGSALYENLMTTGSIGKDMFHHDWNLPSIVLQDGKTQHSRRNAVNALRDNINAFALRAHFSQSRFERRFRWRHLGVVAERLLCSSAQDIRRYLVAKNETVPLTARHTYIVDSVVNARLLRRLTTTTRWKSPLSLRNGLWSHDPICSSSPRNSQ